MLKNWQTLTVSLANKSMTEGPLFQENTPFCCIYLFTVQNVPVLQSGESVCPTSFFCLQILSCNHGCVPHGSVLGTLYFSPLLIHFLILIILILLFFLFLLIFFLFLSFIFLFLLLFLKTIQKISSVSLRNLKHVMFSNKVRCAVRPPTTASTVSRER